MGCIQSKSVLDVPVKQLELKPNDAPIENNARLLNVHQPAEVRRKISTLDLDSMLKRSSSFTTTVVHIEATNTTNDNPYGKPIDLFYDGIFEGLILGTGISGIVRKCIHKKTGHKYAVKCLDLEKVGDSKGLECLKSEILIMSELDHPSIVRLEEVYESSDEIYLVQQLCHGGELFDKLEDQEDYHYSEGECARLVKQMLTSVRYIHSKGIVHRDLKLENFLFSTTKNDSELKLIDFGLSKYFVEGDFMSEAVGTPYTIAPETITGRYDERVDLWAIGVIAYLLLSGETPFGGAGGEEPLSEVRDNILRGSYTFEPDYIWKDVSDSAKDFINQLLQVDPDKRIRSAEDAQRHPWIMGWSERQKSGSPTDVLLSQNVIQNLIEFKGFSDMRKLLCEVLSFTLLPDQIHDLKKEFEILDSEGSGEITMESWKKVLVESAFVGSLGALMEDEVEDIFNAMKLQKTGASIRWHEFIAACLSLCQVDDRNLRIAFDRLDSDHKGYISLNNVMNLMGYAEEHTKEKVKKMYKAELDAGSESKEGLTYEDFILLIKGQSKVSSMCLGVEREESKENCIPENVHGDEKMESILNDEQISALEVNQNIYQSHRQMRTYLSAASKQLEDVQHQRHLEHGTPITPALLRSSRIVHQQSSGSQSRRERRFKSKSDLSGMMVPKRASVVYRRSSKLIISPENNFGGRPSCLNQKRRKSDFDALTHDICTLNEL